MLTLNLYAPIAQTGYGVVATNIAKTLHANGHDVRLQPIRGLQTEHGDENLFKLLAKKCFVQEAPCLKIWHQFDLGLRVGKGPYWAMPIFELDMFTEIERYHLSFPDALCVCSQWAKQVIEENHIETPTYVVPLGVNTNVFKPPANLLDQTIKKTPPYTFLNVGKWEKRKGHDILVEAFNKAFTDKDNVRLIMMPTNIFLTEEKRLQWHKLYVDSPLGYKIHILPYMRTHKDVYEIMLMADCGVFPSRAEGWNLELLEMMSIGKPVITTNYSAHTEYCTPQNSYLLDIKETEPAHDNQWFFGQGNWAKLTSATIDSLVDYMRFCYKNRPQNPAGIQTGQKYTWQNTVNILSQCIQDDLIRRYP